MGVSPRQPRELIDPRAAEILWLRRTRKATLELRRMTQQVRRSVVSDRPRRAPPF